MVVVINLWLALVALLMVVAGIRLAFKTYTHGRHAMTLYSSYLLVGGWIVFDAINILLPHPIIVFNRLASTSISIALFLMHWHYDERSASFHQRVSMTVGSILMGVNVGMAWLQSSVVLLTDGTSVVSNEYSVLLYLQGVLVVQSVLIYLTTQSTLATHYGLTELRGASRFAPHIRSSLITILVLGFVFLLIPFPGVPSNYLRPEPFKLLVAFGFMILGSIGFRNTLASMIIAQPLQAIALVVQQQVKFIHVYAKSGYSAMQSSDFGQFISHLSRLFAELTRSESTITSLNTNEMAIVFEPISDGQLILVLSETGPMVRRWLRQIAAEIQHIETQEQFSQLVQSRLMSTVQF